MLRPLRPDEHLKAFFVAVDAISRRTVFKRYFSLSGFLLSPSNLAVSGYIFGEETN